MKRSDIVPDLTPLRSSLPEGCGIVVYERSALAPWKLHGIVGDCPGVLGVPGPAVPEVWSELVHPEDAPRVEDALHALAPGDVATLEYRLRTAVGGERWVRDSVRRPASRADVLTGALRDVSIEHTLREQIGALEERIWQAQRVDSLGSLAAGIAHDLRNLLTAIVTAVQLVEAEDGLPDAVREDLEVARESARRGSEFVKQILRFAAREGYRPGPVDLNAVIEDLRPILARSLGTDIRLVVSHDPELPRIHCDPGQMEQVLLNLATNAREAMPGGGRLAISTRRTQLGSPLATQSGTLRSGDYVALSVGDTGRGIPEEMILRIFEPFFSTKARRDFATGFGLSTVERIVSRHGGGVRVESASGQGATFHIYLPVPAPAVAPRTAEAPAVRRTVLVVEPDGYVRELVRRTLAGAEFEVIPAASSREAMRLVEQTRPKLDLLVTAVTTGDGSGTELARLLRDRVGPLPVVHLAQAGARVAHAEVQGGGVLRRPFTSGQLLEAARAALPPVADAASEADGTTGA